MPVRHIDSDAHLTAGLPKKKILHISVSDSGGDRYSRRRPAQRYWAGEFCHATISSGQGRSGSCIGRIGITRKQDDLTFRSDRGLASWEVGLADTAAQRIGISEEQAAGRLFAGRKALCSTNVWPDANGCCLWKGWHADYPVFPAFRPLLTCTPGENHFQPLLHPPLLA